MSRGELLCGEVLVRRDSGEKVRIVHVIGETVTVAPVVMGLGGDVLVVVPFGLVDVEFERTDEVA